MSNRSMQNTIQKHQHKIAGAIFALLFFALVVGGGYYAYQNLGEEDPESSFSPSTEPAATPSAEPEKPSEKPEPAATPSAKPSEKPSEKKPAPKPSAKKPEPKKPEPTPNPPVGIPSICFSGQTLSARGKADCATKTFDYCMANQQDCTRRLQCMYNNPRISKSTKMLVIESAKKESNLKNKVASAYSTYMRLGSSSASCQYKCKDGDVYALQGNGKTYSKTGDACGCGSTGTADGSGVCSILTKEELKKNEEEAEKARQAEIAARKKAQDAAKAAMRKKCKEGKVWSKKYRNEDCKGGSKPNPRDTCIKRDCKTFSNGQCSYKGHWQDMGSWYFRGRCDP